MLLPPFHNGFVPRTVPVPALRPCLTHTAFASPWYARLLRPQQRHGNTSPGSIISGDGYSVFKVQYQEGNESFH